ncbi:hypothetical protein BDL97_03G080700 [Sphagnum fallax]|uniref:Uncharacterized protein n=1 Tax=Sphagnum jensenii TaxID=128206 RepID=A0ABP1BED4_9BRYO|nr:hypothetical protein BDL97_03G080700 [Sphagnum fallax]
MASHHEWWAYGSNQNQYLDTEELSSTPICMEVYFPGLANNRSLQDKVRKTCRSMGLDYSISGNVVSVSGYPCSEHMDEDYVLMVFEALDDRARLV